MALKRVGTKIVAEDAAKATADTKRFNDEVRKTGLAAQEGSRGIGGWVGSIAKGVTIGNLATGVIRGIGNAMRSIASETIQAVGAQEMLTQSLTSLVAKEIKSSDATMEMTDALEQAGPRAADLLKWIQQLAIKSPFDQEGVAMAFRTSMAYGFTTAEAQRLTQATIDTSTALGAGTDVMNRVALALGQMRAKGKVSGEELRQLTEAGLATQPTLDAMGVTLDDVSRGMVSADEFTQKFIETLEADFGGAAERSAGTLTGLLNSLGDIKTMGLVELFTPLKNELVPVLSQFTDLLQSRLLPVLTLVGQGLGTVTRWVIANKEAILKGAIVIGSMIAAYIVVVKWTAIWTAVSAAATLATSALGAAIAFLTSPIAIVAAAVAGLVGLFVFSFSDIKEKTGGFFQGMGKDLFSFGHGIIMALAQGMAAAIGAILDVLNAIGGLIANWLSPGSPPKLLPDIDKWGMGAMQEYLKGFTMADFDVFGQASDTIEKYLRGIDMPEDKLVPTIAKSRTALSALIKEYRDTGKVGEESFQNLFKAIGMANPAMQQYLRETIAVQMAQEKLNNISKKYNEILSPLTTELAGIQKERQKYIDDQRKAELESIVADASAPADAKRLAMMELREMAIKEQIAATEEQRDTEMSAAQTELDAATERMNAQKAMLDIQAENNSLLQEQLGLMENLAGAIGSMASAAGGLSDALKGVGGLGGVEPPDPGEGGPFQNVLDEWKEKISGTFDEIKAKFAPLEAKLNTLKETWGTVFANIWLSVQGAWNFMKPYLQNMWDWLSTNIPQALEIARGWWVDTAWPAITEAATSAWDGMKTAGNNIYNWLTVTMPAQLMYARDKWLHNWNNIKSAVSAAWERIKSGAESVRIWLTETMPNWLKYTEERWKFVWYQIRNFVPNVIEYIRSLVASKIEALAEKMGIDLDSMKARWSAIWEDVKLIVSTVWGNIVTAVSEKVELVRQWIEEKVTAIRDFWAPIWDEVSLKLTNVWNAIVTAVAEKVESVRSNIETKTGEVKTKWGEIWDEISKKLSEIWEGIKTAVAEKVEEVYTAVTEKIDAIKTWIAEKVTDFITLGKDLLQGIIDGITERAGALLSAITSAIENAIQAAKDKLGIDSPSKIFMEIGGNVSAGFAKGILDTTGMMQRAVGSAIGSTIPYTPPASAAQQTTVYNNNYQIQPIGNANINNGMDLAMLQNFIEQSVIGAMRS